MTVRRYVGAYSMERVTLIIMVGVMIALIAVVFAVLGKGEYKPPPQEEQGYVIQAMRPL